MIQLKYNHPVFFLNNYFISDIIKYTNNEN